METARQRTIRLGARLEKEAVTSAKVAEPTSVETTSIALAIDGGHVRSARRYQGRSFEVLLAQVTNDDRKQIVFSSVPAEAVRSNGTSCAAFFINSAGTAVTPVTILSDGSEGPRALGEAASPGPDSSYTRLLGWTAPASSARLGLPSTKTGAVHVPD